MKKFIRVLIRVIAGVMLFSAILLILNNRGIISMCSAPDKTSRPNENFSVANMVDENEKDLH